MLLINRLQPIPYERLESYLERLRRANYYDKTRWYDDFLVSPIPKRVDLLRDACHYIELGAVTGLSVDAIHKLTLHRFVSMLGDEAVYRQYYSQISPHSYIDRPLWGERQSPIYARGTGRVAVCPQCYKEQRAFLLPWLMQHVTTCLSHNILLVDCCPVCKGPLQVDVSSGACHKCQTKIEDFPALSIVNHVHSQYLTTLMWSAFRCGTTPFPPPDLPIALTHPLWSMVPSTFLRWSWRIAELIAEYDPENPFFDCAFTLLSLQRPLPPTNLQRASVLEAHVGLCAIWCILQGWPDSWNETVARLTSLDQYRSREKSRFGNRLRKEFRGSKWEWLHAQNLSVNHLTKIQQAIAQHQRRPREITLPYDFGIDEKLLDHDTSCLRLDEASELLNTNQKQVMALVSAGLLEIENGQIPDSISEVQVRPAAIRRLLQRTLSHLPVVPLASENSSPPLTFTRILDFLGRKGLTLPRILIAMRNGDLPAYRAEETLSLTAVWATNEDVRAYREHLPQIDPNSLLSSETLCQQLDCHPLMLRRLYANGLLIPVQEVLSTLPIQCWYDPRDVAAFVNRQLSIEKTRHALAARSFGQFIRHLRLLDGLREVDIVERLSQPPFWLEVREEHVYEWEEGQRFPNAREKAALVAVLRASVRQTDALLLFPEASDDARTKTLAVELATIEDEVPLLQFETRLAPLADAYGVEVAKQSHEQRSLDNRDVGLPDPTQALVSKIWLLFDALAAKSDDLAMRFLRFGEFIVENRGQTDQLPITKLATDT